MGILPCVRNMPYRITQTEAANKSIVFKHRRCRLFGWKLHETDRLRLEKCTTPEMKLEYLPEELFVKIENATWTWSPELGPGVISLKPKAVMWYLDKLGQVGVRRKGFTVASDFSGTAHSFAGDNLPAAFIDCLPWNMKPDRPAQLSGYMSISRVRKIDDIYITQPYAPTLFSQGDLPGPELLLEFQRRQLERSDLASAWQKRRACAKPSREKWPDHMPLYCRGCSERTGDNIEQPLKEFHYASTDSTYGDVIAKGMERFLQALR